MKTRRQNNSWDRELSTPDGLARGMGWGLTAGFVGTLVMDLILMGVLSALGRPAFTCFSMIGDTAARLFSKFGTEIAGGITAGVTAHYLIGPIVGAIFGVAVLRINALRVDTLKKGIILAVLYVEILSQPILAATPLLLGMTATGTLKWFGGSFIMHLIWGIITGGVISYGLLFETPSSRRSYLIT